MDVMEEIRQLAAELQREIDKFVDTVNDTLRRIPDWAGWVRDRLMAAWGDFTDKVAELWQKFDEEMFHPGYPGELSATANQWNTDVGGPVSSQVGTVQAGQLAVDDHWQGSAADKYRQHLSPQASAMDKIKTSLTAGITSALDKMQGAITVFWWAFAGALAALIVGIIGAAASAATVFGLPASPFIGAGACSVFITAIFAAGEHKAREARSANTILIDKMNDLGAFPGGSWPRATLS